MSDLTREMIPIIVMYGFVLLLAPFIAMAMWMAFDGDRLRVDAEEGAPTAADAPAAPRLDVVPAAAS